MIKKIQALGFIGIRKIVSVIYRFFGIFPVKNNRIFLQSYFAYGFTDNPKCLCEYLHDKYPNHFEYVVAVNKNEDNDNVNYIREVRYYSVKWVYYLATSSVVVWNSGQPSWLSRRKKQLVIETWHGGGAFKRTDVMNSNTIVNGWLKKRHNRYVNLFVSSSRVFTQSNIFEGRQYNGKILSCGMPRNDLLFSPELVNSCSDKVRHEYGLGNAFCVLYAPTFRGDGERKDKIKTLPPLAEVADVLMEKTGRDVVILLRKHHCDKNPYNIPGAMVDVGDYPDMQELICCSDLLITDYSSTMWDFALLGRPCYLFVPDREEYERDRGFFTPIEEWPGIVCNNAEELLEKISELDFEYSRRIAEQYLEKAISYENGHAAEKLANLIVKHIEGKHT